MERERARETRRLRAAVDPAPQRRDALDDVVQRAAKAASSRAAAHRERRVLAEEAHRRAAGELHAALLLVDRGPDASDSSPRRPRSSIATPALLQAVAELEILVAVAGERFVEAADALEILAPHRGVAGEEVEPREALARARMQRIAQPRIVASCAGTRRTSRPGPRSRRRRSAAPSPCRARWRASRSGDAMMSASVKSTSGARAAAIPALRARGAARCRGRAGGAGCGAVVRELGQILGRPVVRLRIGDDHLEGVGTRLLREQRRDDVAQRCRGDCRSERRRRCAAGRS